MAIVKPCAGTFYDELFVSGLVNRSGDLALLVPHCLRELLLNVLRSTCFLEQTILVVIVIIFFVSRCLEVMAFEIRLVHGLVDVPPLMVLLLHALFPLHVEIELEAGPQVLQIHVSGCRARVLLIRADVDEVPFVDVLLVRSLEARGVLGVADHTEELGVRLVHDLALFHLDGGLAVETMSLHLLVYLSHRNFLLLLITVTLLLQSCV